MNEGMWVDVLKTQGVATVLILVAILVLWVWVLPEWRQQNKRKLELEEQRQQLEADHRAKLLGDQRKEREEHREERKHLLDTHRADTQNQYNVFREMVLSIRIGLDNNSREIAKNSALTVAAAEVMGASRQTVKARASQLAGREVDVDLEGLSK